MNASYDQWNVSAFREIDAAIDGLDDSLRSAGLPGLEAPDDPSGTSDVAEVVAPYELPAELRRFWEQVDPQRMEVHTFPRLGGPADALALRQSLREYGAPPVLLPIDYASHCFGVIELGSEWGEGGTILEWEMDGSLIVSHSLADRIAVLGELVAEGLFERGDGYVALDHRAEQEKRLARLDAFGPHPVYGDLRAIPLELESWPAHWLEASGVDLADRIPRGATHTIAELVAAASQGPVTGRIHGTVILLVGSGSGALVVVDDGTRPLDVWCPAGASTWGPVHKSRFELEVTLERPAGAPPDLVTGHAEIARNALAGDMPGAQAAAGRFAEEVQEHRAAAVATDIRPLD